MDRHHHPRTGFTLIELMVALGLSTGIVLVAVSTVRMASRSTTALERIALDHALLQAGVIQALDEVDFWTAADDPGDSTRQPLRQTLRTASGFNAGRPFTPFSTLAGRSSSSFIGGASERFTTWDPSPMAWDPGDPRTWCRLNTAEHLFSDLRWGDYRLYSYVDPSQCPFDPNRCRSWYGNQVRLLMDALGHYGMCEYLPSNVLYSYYGPVPGSLTAGVGNGLSPGGIPVALVKDAPMTGIASDYGQAFARGRWRMNWGLAAPLANPDQPLITADGNRRTSGTDPHRTLWAVGSAEFSLLGNETQLEKAQLIASFLTNTRHGGALLPIRPYNWPDVTSTVHRYIRGRTVNLCLISLFHATTGEHTMLPFTCLGTTLRGARQQRTRSGWSTYDNQNPQTVKLGENLDHPALVIHSPR